MVSSFFGVSDFGLHTVYGLGFNVAWIYSRLHRVYGFRLQAWGSIGPLPIGIGLRRICTGLKAFWASEFSVSNSRSACLPETVYSGSVACMRLSTTSAETRSNRLLDQGPWVLSAEKLGGCTDEGLGF